MFIKDSPTLGKIPGDIKFNIISSYIETNNPFTSTTNLSNNTSGSDSRPTTSDSIASTTYTSNTSTSNVSSLNASTSNTSTNFSENIFTPTTYRELDLCLKANAENLNNIEKTSNDPLLTESLRDKLIAEGAYLLDQKLNHWNASYEKGVNTPLNDDDSDVIHKQILDLRDRANSLVEKSSRNPSRLEVIKEEENS